MKDFLLWSQILIFALNVAVFIYLMSKEDIYLRQARIALLVVLTVAGMVSLVINQGKLTWINVVFSFTPAITLFKINPNGTIFNFIERVRGNSRWSKKHLHNLQGSDKALSRKEAQA